MSVRLKFGTNVVYDLFIVGKRTSLLLLILPFTFLCLQFPNSKSNCHFFLGTEGPTKLKLGTQMDSGSINRVYWNQGADAYFVPLFLHFSSLIPKH